MTNETSIKGSCHCGNIQYEFVPKLDLGSLPVRICGCSFCTKHGNRYTSDLDGSLTVTVKNPEKVKDYRFASGTVGFVFCTECGIMPFAKLDIENRTYGLVNINTSDHEFDVTKAQSFDYSSETVEDSLKRRQKNWIGNVIIESSN